MLPSEMALLAHGWPRKVADNPEGAAAAAAAGGSRVSLSSVGSQDEEGQLIEEQYYLPGKFLFSLRNAVCAGFTVFHMWREHCRSQQAGRRLVAVEVREWKL
jgi:hypothetical protein